MLAQNSNLNLKTADLRKPIEHICFADDDPDEHLIFSDAIGEFFPSIKVSSFYRCSDLIDYLNDENKPLPDIIFLDYTMPGNDGNQCLQLIKKTARLLHIPIIIYSTSDYRKFIEASYNQGAYKYIVKPDRFEKVKSTMKQVFAEYENGEPV